MLLSSPKTRGWRIAAATGLVGLAAAVGPITAAQPASATTTPSTVQLTPTGLPAGAIKHVWLIILENKSYDATFTGLNQNTYLYQTLPSQGALLTQYYGTGHFSLDNYTALVSGQATAPADQNDCPIYQDMQGTVLNNNAPDSGGVPGVTDNGQFMESGSPYATYTPGTGSTLLTEGTHGGTGCVYPASVQTLFNQFDAAGISWKGYAQDLGNTDTGSAPHAVNKCGGPGSTPSTVGVPNPGSANATDQYVPKHFPFPWFESLLTNAGDCTSSEIANLDSPTSGLVHDLASESTTPAFSWITPDNCSDAHDAICAGNNLSGAFNPDGTPNYGTGTTAYQPESTTPTNYTGGLYASDLFLKYYVPLIEQSAAFKDGGLIDITFDEANPPFANSSFNNANNPGNSGSFVAPATAAEYAKSDTAAESFVDSQGNVTTANAEPAGPNTPLLVDSNGNQVYPGPGDSGFINRPSSLSGDPTNDPSYVRGGGGSTPGARTDSAASNVALLDATHIQDDSTTAPDSGRAVSGTGIPTGACVGAVTDSGPRFDTVGSGQAVAPTNPANKAYHGSFQVVDCTSGQPDTLTGPVTSVTFAGETSSTDPLFSSTIQTPGGGDTGSVLISPYITPGTVSNVAYNHYSWLRTMEDVFNVDGQYGPTATGQVSPGTDGLGHLGFAGQAGLKDFGADVFTNPTGTSPGNPLPEAPLAVALPVLGLLAGGGLYLVRRRRQAPVAA